MIVYDQGKANTEGCRVEYLKDLHRDNIIKLVRGKYRKRSDLDGHGKAIKALLKNCNTELAMLFSSDVEVLHPEWLGVLADMIRSKKVLGVTNFKPAANHWDRNWIAPRYIPCWMMLNMEAYKDFQGEDDWDLSFVPFSEWKHPEVFKGLKPPANPDYKPIQVFRDTGWRIWEKLEYENPKRLRILPLPYGYLDDMIRHYEGIDRNSFRPEHPFVKGQRKKIQERLKRLRNSR